MARSRKNPRGRPSSRRQTELLHGMHSVLEAIRAGRRELLRLYLWKDPADEILAPILFEARGAGIPIREVAFESIQDRLGPEGNPQGVALEVGALPEHRLEELGGGTKGQRRLLALDGVEDPQNVGALIRVAEAAGVDGLVLTHRRAPPLSPALARASAGAVEWLPVARVPNLVQGIKWLKSEGFWAVGANPEAKDSVFEAPDRILGGDLVVVLGAEGRGLRPSVQREIDHSLRIPMRGRVASLNVATAGAVLLFELMRRSLLRHPS